MADTSGDRWRYIGDWAWGTVRSTILIAAAYFFLTPFGTQSWLGIAAGLMALLAFVYLRQVLMWAALGATVVIFAVAVATIPLWTPDRLYVVQCAQLSLDCLRTHVVELAGRRAVIYPVLDPVKMRAFEVMAPRQSAKFQSLPIARASNGQYLVHAPLERDMARVAAQSDSGAYLNASVPALAIDQSVSVELGTPFANSFAFSFGYLPDALSFVFAKSESTPGFFGAISATQPGLTEWQEAVEGDLVLEGLLGGEFSWVRQALAKPSAQTSPRAELRRQVLADMVESTLRGGNVLWQDRLSAARTLLEINRPALGSLSPDDPVVMQANYHLSDAFLGIAAEGDTAREQAFIEEMLAYYNALFASERNWAQSVTPSMERAMLSAAIPDARDEKVDALVERGFDKDDAASAEAYFATIRATLAAGADEGEIGAFSSLLSTDNFAGIETRVRALHGRARAAAIWDLAGAAEREFSASDVAGMMEVAQGGKNAAERFAAREKILQTRTARVAGLAEQLMAAERSATSRAVQYRVAGLRRMSKVFGGLNAVIQAGGFSEMDENASPLLRFTKFLATETGHLDFAAALPEMTSFTADKTQNVAIAHRAILAASASDTASTAAQRAAVLLMLAARLPDVKIEPAVLDRLWSQFGPDGKWPQSMIGVEAVRGLMLLNGDARAKALAGSVLGALGGDAPWLLAPLYARHLESEFLWVRDGAARARYEKAVAENIGRAGAR